MVGAAMFVTVASITSRASASSTSARIAHIRRLERRTVTRPGSVKVVMRNALLGYVRGAPPGRPLIPPTNVAAPIRHRRPGFFPLATLAGSERCGQAGGQRGPREQGGLQRVVEIGLARPGGEAGLVGRRQLVPPAAVAPVDQVQRGVVPELAVPAVVGRVAGGPVQVGRGADRLGRHPVKTGTPSPSTV